MATKSFFVPFIIGSCLALLPLVLTQLECQGSENVQNHIENVVDQVPIKILVLEQVSKKTIFLELDC